MTRSDQPASGPDVRAEVVDRYSALARAAHAGERIRDCDPGEFTDGGFGPAGYADLSDLPEGAVRASLGCGNPVAVAALKPGETVLDLGSGGGIDVLLSAGRVGPAGNVYGLDASADMIALAEDNAARAGVVNAEFLRGNIEDIPLPDGHVDAVISNCVINLSADKGQVLAEVFRVLRPGGRLGVSDMIAEDGIDPARLAAAEQQVGCTTSTITAAAYRELLESRGFTSIRIIVTNDTGLGVQSAIIRAQRPL
jgi:SAM-dependent methyltransferase